MSGSGRQGNASSMVTRAASEHSAQEPVATGGMLGRYAAAALVVLALAVSIRPVLAVFMAVAGMGGR